LLQVEKSAPTSISLGTAASPQHAESVTVSESLPGSGAIGELRSLPAAAVALPDEAVLSGLHAKVRVHAWALTLKFKSLLSWVMGLWVTDYWEPGLILFCLLIVLVFAISQEFLMDESREENLMFNWLHEQEHRKHDFVEVLDYVSIDAHGGLQKLESIGRGSSSWNFRILICATRLGAALFNIYFLVDLNTRIMRGAIAYYELGVLVRVLPVDMQRYMSYTSSMALVGVSHAALVAVAELGGVVVLITMALYRVIIFILRSTSKRNKFDAFSSLFEAAWAIFVLSTFSALKLFALVHPCLIWRDFDEHLAKPFFGQSRGGRTFQTVYFLGTRFLAVLVGVCAFGVKVAFVCVHLFEPVKNDLHPFISLVWRWSYLFALLIQTMGALIMEKVLLLRVQNFIAGGMDSKVSAEGYVMREVYMARVAQVLYQEHWMKGRRFEFLVLLLTFSDMDLQHLLLDEDEEKREIRLATYKTVLERAKTVA